jgi:uncharacterized cupin superfamily protein
VLAHWDEVEGGHAEVGHLAGTWRDLGRAAGSVTIGVKRIEVDPGKWSTPVHRQTGEEELFYVLGGSGICLQDEIAYEVGPGDCLVFLARGHTHSLKAGAEGLDVLAFGMRGATEIGHLPRAGVAWIGGTWADVGDGDHPWDREVAAGEPEVPALSERPANAVNLADVEGEEGGTWKRLGRAAGSQRTGLNWGRLGPNEPDENEHVHAAEEELFVVLEGGGTIFLGGQARAVRAGSVVSRPAGTRIAHNWQAGPEGLTVLFYGTREPNDIIWYPRSRELFVKGVGVTLKVPEED